MDQAIRRQIYTLLIVVSAALIFGRIAAVDSIPDRAIENARRAVIPARVAQRRAELRKRGVAEDRIERDLKQLARRLLEDAKKDRPTLSANDRSRWLTIRALVEPDCRLYRYVPLDRAGKEGPYSAEEIKRGCSCPCPDRFCRENCPPGAAYQKQWVPFAIDKVMETGGWETIDMVKHGLKDEQYDPANPHSGYLYSSKPTLLPAVMAVPYWILYHTTGLSLANHPFLTARILLVIYNLLPLVLSWVLMARLIERYGKTDWGRIAAVATLCFATFLSTFAVTVNNHLPGFVSVIIALYCASRILDGDQRWYQFLGAGLFGAFAVACELPAALIALLLCVVLLVRAPVKTLTISVSAGLVVAFLFFGTNYIAHQTIKPAYAQKRDHLAVARAEHPDDPDNVSVGSFDPDDWYIYRYFPAGKARDTKLARTSYWANRTGVDKGEPSMLVYLLHTTIGHHGVFSLSPIWILSFIGAFSIGFRRQSAPAARAMALTVLAVTAVFFAFYISRPQGDRSYGGITSGLRWFFPLIPFWFLTILEPLDRMASSRAGRAVVLALLALSVMSVSYPVWNPWTHPWFYDLMVSMHWI